MTNRDYFYWPNWLSRSVFIELALFFSAAIFIDFTMFSGDRFFSVSPHPFWIPVLLLSVYYGTGPGLLAAAVSTIVLLLGNMPEADPNQDMYEYFSALVMSPLLWGVSAVILGELSSRRLSERQVAREQLAELKQEANENELHLKEFKRQVEKLELRLAADSKTLRLALRRMEAIQHADIQSLLDNVAPLIRDLHQAPQCSVFFVQNKALEAVMVSGWEESNTLVSRFEPSSSLYNAVIGQGRSLCVANAGDKQILGVQGDLAEPLVDEKTGTVFGMLKIGGLSFVDLNHDAIVMLRILAEIISAALVRAAHVDAVEARVSNYVDREKANPDGSLDFIKWLVKLGDRAGFQSSFIVFRLDEENVTPATVRAFQSAISAAVMEELRSTDRVFELDQNKMVSIVALPAADLDQGLHAAKKLRAALHRMMPGPLSQLSYRMSVSKGFV